MEKSLNKNNKREPLIINSSDYLFLRKISIKNFMLHSDTELLIKKPILIISGANGSGKTQILEALMILLGEKSPRSRKGLKSIINDKDS